MVNGNYVLYGDRPSSESEIVNDHVQTRTAERKERKKSQRNSNEQHGAANAAFDNETDSVKYEKKVKEPRLLRYVPTTDVEEHFVTEKFETYDMKPSEERPRRYTFTKKTKNPTDGSVNYAYSRSNSNSPNGNLPTIAEHGEQYSTFHVRGMPTSKENDSLPPYESKLEKYFVKPREAKKFKSKISYNGSHPDSLYRVPNSSGTEGGKMARVIRTLRWPVALIVVCAALAIFVYFLMPDNLNPDIEMLNSTYWENNGIDQMPQGLESSSKTPKQRTTSTPSPTSTIKSGTSKKPIEIDFYDATTERNYDLVSIVDSVTSKKPNRLIPVPPVFPSHLEPEVQYGNEEADKDKQRSSKAFDDKNKLTEESTLKPHITQKPEKPLAIYFEDAAPIHPETINRAETVNDFNLYEKIKNTEEPKRYAEQIKRYPEQRKRLPEQYKEYANQPKRQPTPSFILPGTQEYYPERAAYADAKFTSGHSKFFGISIEDVGKMQSTTQSSAYNTRVSPTLPTWRDGDDSTTKNYPVNLNIDVPQCRSPQLELCRGVLPYDLAGPAPKISGSDISSFLTEMEYVVSTNCSERARLFVCSLLEPECNPAPYPPKKPCYSLCKAVVDECENFIPRNVGPAFQCRQYDNNNCMKARAPCSIREKACRDGTCIPRDWVCDGNRDCPSGEDEQHCSQCQDNEYQCPSGGCVHKRWICDGYLDCPEGDDEKDATCAEFGIRRASPNVELAEPRELGEEGAGSAPAPAVRRPIELPGRGGRRRSSSSRTVADDTSKELLVTSDSSYNLMRNYSRIGNRLSPYRPRVPLPLSQEDTSDEQTTTTNINPDNLKVIPKNKPSKTNPRQSETAKRADFLGLDDDIDEEVKKEVKIKKDTEPKTNVNSQRQPVMREFPADDGGQSKFTPLKLVNNTNSNVERFIDGGALLRKAALQEEQEKKIARSRVVVEEELQERELGGGRSSPCPAGELRCVDGLCIAITQLCDGTIDCSDHADEDNCYT